MGQVHEGLKGAYSLFVRRYVTDTLRRKWCIQSIDS